MPSSSFYIGLGLIGGILLGMGGTFSSSWDPKVSSNPAAGGLMLVGIILLLVLAGGGVMDLRKRYREWNIEEKSDNLKLKEKEYELQRREHEFKQSQNDLHYGDEKISDKTYYQSSGPTYPKNYVPEPPLSRTYPKDFNPTKNIQKSPIVEKSKTTKTKTAKPKVKKTIEVDETPKIEPEPVESPPEEHLKTEMPKATSESKIIQPKETEKESKHEEKSILETGKPVSKDLTQNKVEQIVEKSTIEPDSSTYTDEDFEHAISLSKHLQCLWKLLNAPGNGFQTKSQLIIAIKGTDSNRSPYYETIDELEEKGLVSVVKEPYSDLLRSKGSVRITQLGIDLIKRARTEKVTSWYDFLGKFKSELGSE